MKTDKHTVIASSIFVIFLLLVSQINDEELSVVYRKLTVADKPKPVVSNTGAVHGVIVRNPPKPIPIENEPIERFVAVIPETEQVSVPEPEPIPVPTKRESEVVVTFDTRPPEELLEEARIILMSKTGPYDKAMADLRSIILSQPKDKARQAHEWLGLAYEKDRQFEKAKAEYGAYLNLYSDNDDDRTRVRQRLMALEIMTPKERLAVGDKRKPQEGNSSSASGTISEYVYVDAKQVNSITGVQLSGHYQHNQYVTSARLRLTAFKEFMLRQTQKLNLSQVYVDFADTFKQYSIRLGRQPSVAGATSRFDGASARYTINRDVTVAVATGSPYTGSSAVQRNFIGTAVDWDVNSDWALGGYYNRQVADGFLERSAVGSEVRYRSNNSNYIFLTEYDTKFHSINQISFQGIKYIGPYDLFAIYERRKSPMPYADSAFRIGMLSQDKRIYHSVSDLFENSGLSSSQVYSYIDGTSQTASSYVLGATRRLGKDWTGTLDVQSTNLSPTREFSIAEQFEPVPLQVGQKSNYSATFHLKGDNVWFQNNNAEFVISKTAPKQSEYLVFSDSYRFGLNNRNSLSTILRYDGFDTGYGKVKSFSGTLRGLYAIGDKTMFEFQLSKDSTKNQSVYLGVRYDFE
jgi:tetratricopeptide (TPR) repeat protein